MPKSTLHAQVDAVPSTRAAGLARVSLHAHLVTSLALPAARVSQPHIPSAWFTAERFGSQPLLSCLAAVPKKEGGGGGRCCWVLCAELTQKDVNTKGTGIAAASNCC